MIVVGEFSRRVGVTLPNSNLEAVRVLISGERHTACEKRQPPSSKAQLVLEVDTVVAVAQNIPSLLFSSTCDKDEDAQQGARTRAHFEAIQG